MTEGLKELGARFKQKRMEMHLTLKEVENATSIRMNFLESIEEGEVHKRLSSIYALGFLKQYASFLGFDVEQLLKENHKALLLPKEKHDFEYGIGTLNARGTEKWWKNLSLGAWIGIVFSVGITIFLLGKVVGIF